MIFRYLFEGSEGSIRFIRRYLGDSIHHHLQSILMSSWIICLTADILMGSRFWRNGGSLVFGLDPFSDAFLAKVSALSLPIEFMWPAIQVKDIGESGSSSLECSFVLTFWLLYRVGSVSARWETGLDGDLNGEIPTPTSEPLLYREEFKHRAILMKTRLGHQRNVTSRRNLGLDERQVCDPLGHRDSTDAAIVGMQAWLRSHVSRHTI